ncbi:MAG: pyridoxal phosphate-dependent aminotransferase [Candidatus Aureabacteria bacterium]|nr:pyridoxal phosphate-dependent aminotransferase [Candidatus Auribacterota bacterium]
MKAGIFSRTIEAVEPSQTLAIDGMAKALRAAGKDVVGFGAGEPDFDTPENIKEAARRAMARGQTKYTPVAGTIELRQAVAAKLLCDNGLKYDPGQIVVSCGAKHALYNAVRVLCNPGDEFILIAPYWVTYPAQVVMSGGAPVCVETSAMDGFRIDPEKIKRAVTKKTKALILNSPNNPTGWVASREDLSALAVIACERGLYIISDEIYEKILYPPAAHVSIASLGEEIKKRTVLINGVSKSHSMTGWRIGYLAAEPEIARLGEKLQSHCTSNPDSIAQAAAVEALNGDQGFVGMMVEKFRERRDYLVSRLQAIPGITCYRPLGAFYAFPDVSAFGLGSAEFAARLLEEALVAVVPGSAFGSDSHIRISYATSMENIKEGMDRIEKFLGKIRTCQK